MRTWRLVLSSPIHPRALVTLARLALQLAVSTLRTCVRNCAPAGRRMRAPTAAGGLRRTRPRIRGGQAELARSRTHGSWGLARQHICHGQ
jgi:hypothetical protein